MSWRVSRINREVKSYDSRLFAVCTSKGMIQIHRKADRLAAIDVECDSELARHQPQLILCLTDTWTREGKPVERGLEPMMEMIRSMDSWSKDGYLDMVKRREREQEDKERQSKNEIRAKAADIRRDFAKAVNDINTSTLEKVDRRRM